MAKIKAEYDYVQGHLRYGSVQMELVGEELEQFKSLSSEEQKDWLKDSGEFILDDYSLEDCGDLGAIVISE